MIGLYSKNSFQANPPNAAIVHAALKSDDKGVAQAVPVELTNPKESSDGWVFHLKALKGQVIIGNYNRVTYSLMMGVSNRTNVVVSKKIWRRGGAYSRRQGKMSA